MTPPAVLVRVVLPVISATAPEYVCAPVVVIAIVLIRIAPVRPAALVIIRLVSGVKPTTPAKLVLPNVETVKP